MNVVGASNLLEAYKKGVNPKVKNRILGIKLKKL
jgi:hypothetical protein